MTIHQSFTFTRKSANSKTGPIPVTTSTSATCPDACPLKVSGCYAKHDRLGMLWAKLSKTKPGRKFVNGANKVRAISWQQLIDKVTALPDGTLWRHNQAGDLPGDNNAIDGKALGQLTRANRGKRGFTYTHKPMTARNAAAVAKANAAGFTINLSADNLSEADELAALEVGPVVALLPMRDIGIGDDESGKTTVRADAVFTPAERRVVICPATYRDHVTCQSCQLCQRQSRKVIVGFPAHGAARKAATKIATAN